MNLLRCIAFVLAAGLGSGPAGAWGPDGHATSGAIADRLLAGTPSAAKVKALLAGLTLHDAANWADCLRGFGPGPAYDYPDKGKHPACRPFETDAGIAEMRDFVRRNDGNCQRRPHEGPCHEAYHYTDVDPALGRYDPHFTGTRDVDIVAASAAAIRVLQGQAAPAPFSIRNRREALLMLAHYAGDLHQPLHAGAVYLDAAGHLLHPRSGPAPAGSSTVGGNDIIPVDAVTGHEMGKLHAMWDDVPAALLAGHLDDAWLAAARAVPATAGDPTAWPAAWAGETIVAARQAFDGVRFKPREGSLWHATLPAGYRDRMTALKKTQLTRAGAHLAQLLQAALK